MAKILCFHPSHFHFTLNPFVEVDNSVGKWKDGGKSREDELGGSITEIN
jgi:hypothetical protein